VGGGGGILFKCPIQLLDLEYSLSIFKSNTTFKYNEPVNPGRKCSSSPITHGPTWKPDGFQISVISKNVRFACRNLGTNMNTILKRTEIALSNTGKGEKSKDLRLLN
jgi:hypothetical protein